MKQVHIIVSGRVQGVYFRANTRDVARELGLKGYVRNLGNGSVEIIAQGEDNELRKLIESCRNGPPGAEVGDIKIQYESIKSTFSGFDVRY